MNARTVTRRRTTGGALRTAGWLSASAMLAVAAFAPAVQAASVTPEPINSGNPTCGSFNSDWDQFKLEGAKLANGTYDDGTLEVTISNFTASDSGTPGSFDWSSNIGVDAVFVKAGSDKHNLYVYDPESLGDTDLGPQEGTGNGISHISFCYDEDQETTPPSDPPSVPPSDPPSVPPSDPPSNPPSVDPSDPPVEESDAPASSGEVKGISGTPKTTLPPTDTIDASGTSTNGSWRIVLAGIAGLIATLLLFSQPTRSRRSR
jgi:hypothetical protein